VAKESRGAALIRTAGLITIVLLCVAAFIWDVTLMRTMIGLQMNDFGRFYYSAGAFLDGKDMYAPSPATQWGAGAIEGAQQLLNLNPPHFHLLVLPLARLAPRLAVMLWMTASIFALVLSLVLVAREINFAMTGTRTMLVLLFVLACAASQAEFVTGQLAFLMLLPATLCWRDARHARWERAGAWLGVLVSVKLFFLIFVPYLIVGRRWRALAAMTATATVCLVAGVLVFHADNYWSWIRALRQSSDWAWLGMNASALGVFQRLFTPTPIFQPLASAPGLVRGWLLVAGVVAFTTLSVTFVDSTKSSVDRAFALLLTAAQIASPAGWIYYLWLAVGPLAAVILRERPSTFFPQSGAIRWPMVVALAGFLTPITLPYSLQRTGLATLTAGSVYFWATLALWIGLVVEFAQGLSQTDYQPL
jgi:glycosyl transferase family 87